MSRQDDLIIWRSFDPTLCLEISFVTKPRNEFDWNPKAIYTFFPDNDDIDDAQLEAMAVEQMAIEMAEIIEMEAENEMQQDIYMMEENMITEGKYFWVISHSINS